MLKKKKEERSQWLPCSYFVLVEVTGRLAWGDELPPGKQRENILLEKDGETLCKQSVCKERPKST